MPEDTKDNKAKKLAAARKKLKEYQIKEKRVDNSDCTPTSATMSEKSDSELNLNSLVLEGGFSTPPADLPSASNFVADTFDTTVAISAPTREETMPSAASYFTSIQPEATASSLHTTVIPAAETGDAVLSIGVPTVQTQQNMNAIQLLITEKSQLNAELSKYRTWCREKDLENEELRTQLATTTNRLDELQQRYIQQQHMEEELRSSVRALQPQLAQSEGKCADQADHLQELQQQFSKSQSQCHEMERLHKEKCNELELAQIRINQLSDESFITKDTRVETLTQTKFMYEQQIRDLQAMVQQLTQDKEQANLQYQNYAQHLNAEVSNLKEKNSEISDECAKLRDRERQLVTHISELEREIQKNITRRDQLKDDREQDSPASTAKQTELIKEIAELKESIADSDFERHEFQLKIKSQEDRLEAYVNELQQKQRLIEELQQHLQNISIEQPDKSKLLAAMESDKIAASRAVTQNVELKKQMDELEQRFVQLTNEKADLMNKLDAEEYANRNVRTQFTHMEARLQSFDERFRFKDEEMIRLSHENMDLQRENLMLQQQVDRLQHYEMTEYHKRYAKDDGNSTEATIPSGANNNLQDSEKEHDHHQHGDDNADYVHSEHHHECKEHEERHQHDDHEQDHEHDHNGHACEHQQVYQENVNYDHNVHYRDHSFRSPGSESETASCQEANEDTDHSVSSCSRPQMIPTTQALEKLQQRFTKLMSQVADLTEEKHLLEHLVVKLQGETETIGEYVALYQTQRRVLMQREYEKAAQMQLLKKEREQMQEKIAILNNLVSTLSGTELPNNTRLAEHFSSALAGAPPAQKTVNIQPAFGEESSENRQQQIVEPIQPLKLNSTESKEILTKIQSIITEITADTKDLPTATPTVDHLKCCSGKFEVV